MVSLVGVATSSDPMSFGLMRESRVNYRGWVFSLAEK